MKTSQSIPPDLATRIAALAELLGPAAEEEARLVGLYLFGSRATGDEHAGSDVDLGSLFSEKIGVWDLLGLENRFEDCLRAGGIAATVQLVDVGQASAFLALEIIRGERIYSADEDACDNFDLYVLRRAGDLAHHERERRRMILGLEDETEAGP